MIPGFKGDLKQQIFNEVSENVKALERLFPSAVKDGKVDFEALKEELGQFEEVGPEKYGLTWSGKQNAKKNAQEDLVGRTLKYIEKDSKNPETTENLYIEGDNLEVLKLLRQNYYGAIKMIYIDPPYNTGNDFVYNDSFNMDKTESDIAEGDVSELGERYKVNSSSTNRYHANWLNMIYPRVKVAKELLNEEGVLFVSLDDNEVMNMVKVCDEIFGESNRIALISHKARASVSNDKIISPNHNIILFYAKDIEKIHTIRSKIGLDPDLKGFSLNDNDGSGEYRLVPVDGPGGAKKGNPYYEFLGVQGYFRFSKSTMEEKFKQGLVVKKGESLYQKYYKNFAATTRKTDTTWWDDGGLTSSATSRLKELLGGAYFDNPKPVELIGRMLKLITFDKKNSLILDFFSGSSTTAHAVMQLNAEDGGNRKFIMVQIPEETDEKSEARKAGYKNICEIGRARIYKAGDKIKADNKDKDGIDGLDIGFKVFRVSDTNIRWNYESDNLKTLAAETTSISSDMQTSFFEIAATGSQVKIDEVSSPKDRLDFMPGFKDIDVVYEILLRQRDIPLSAKVEKLRELGERTYIFADSFLVCLEENITKELIEKLAAINPLPMKFILRDSAFGDDIALKDETYRRLTALIERNSGERKKAYTVEFI